MDDTSEKAAELYEEGVAAFRAGDNERSRELTFESLRIGRTIGDTTAIGRGLMGLCRVALRDGDGGSIRGLTKELTALADTSDDGWWHVASLHMRAEHSRMTGALDEAIGLYNESRVRSEQLGLTNMVAAESFNLSLAHIGKGELQEASEALRHHFSIRLSLDGEDLDPTGLIAVAALLLAQGNTADALGVAKACRAALG